MSPYRLSSECDIEARMAERQLILLRNRFGSIRHYFPTYGATRETNVYGQLRFHKGRNDKKIVNYVISNFFQLIPTSVSTIALEITSNPGIRGFGDGL
jgi:hypothetical protein